MSVFSWTTTAEPQSGIWMGKTDDLWQFDKPEGWGGPWWEEPVTANTPSDPYLMTGFDGKCIHITHDAAKNVNFHIEVDFMGHGVFERLLTLTTTRYAQYTFPAGFSANWMRVVADADCTATAQLHYT